MSASVIRLIVLERVSGGSYVALCWVGIDAVTTTSPFYGHTLRCFEQTTSERASVTNTGVVPFMYYIMLSKYSNERHRRLAFDTGTASIVDPSHSCLPALFVLAHFPWEPVHGQPPSWFS